MHEDPPAALLDNPEALCRHAKRLTLQSTPEALVRSRHLLQHALTRWRALGDVHIALASASLASIELECVAPRDGVTLGPRRKSPLKVDPAAPPTTAVD